MAASHIVPGCYQRAMRLLIVGGKDSSSGRERGFTQPHLYKERLHRGNFDIEGRRLVAGDLACIICGRRRAGGIHEFAPHPWVSSADATSVEREYMKGVGRGLRH